MLPVGDFEFNPKRIELVEPVTMYARFSYKCSTCGAHLLEMDNFCAHCGKRVKEETNAAENP